MKQPELIQPEHLSPPLRWQTLFAFLSAWPEPQPKTGRKPINRDALMSLPTPYTATVSRRSKHRTQGKPYLNSCLGI